MKQALVVACAMLGLTCGLAADTGSLASVDPQGKPLGLCPLKHTAVKTEIIRFRHAVRTDAIRRIFSLPCQDSLRAF